MDNKNISPLAETKNVSVTDLPKSGMLPEASTSGGYWRISFILAIVAFVLNALDAYSIYDIPLSRLGALVPFIGFIFCKKKIDVLRKNSGFIVLFLFMSLVTALGCTFGDYDSLMPSKYPGNYESFIALRFVNYLAFLLYTCVLLEIILLGGFRKFAKAISVTACMISIYAIYVYVAQIYSLPEIPRNRLGTGGEAQATIFTYDFHRAMGTFREPSHMASWMVVVIFFPFICWSGWRAVFATALMIGAIVLSGSLSAFLSLLIVAGFFVALQLAGRRSTSFSTVLRGLAVTSISLGIFYLFSFAYDTRGSASYFSTMWDRLAPIFTSQDALMTTNRSYIYQWIEDEGQVPFWGYGLGNSNLVLSASFGSDMVYSFLSIFINVLYSGGFIGFTIFLWVYFKPAIDVIKKYPLLQSREPSVIVALGTYTCMTVFFLGNSEEFNLLFSIPIALMLALKQGSIPNEIGQSNVRRND